ncbi:MAG: GAF domain-containing protein, partial [Anaerolineae bacterium]
AYQVAVAIRNVRQIRAAERLQSAVAALARARGKEAILRAIVTEAHNLIDYEYTSLIVHHQDGTLGKARWIMPPDYEDSFGEPRQQDGLSRIVVQSGEPLVIRDARKDDRVKESMREAGVRSILAMPMVHGSRVQGILYTHTSRPWYFTQYELGLWSAFASHAATVLHNAMEEEASEIWKTLDGEIATCSNPGDIYRLFAERALEALHADLAVYYPFNAMALLGESRLVLENSVWVGDLLTPWQVPKGRGGGVHQALERARDGILIVNDLDAQGGRLRSNLADREQVKAFVGLRLEVVPDGGTEPLTVGNLFLDYRRRTNLEPADLVGLQLAGSRVAAAIQRFYLLDQLEEQRKQLNDRLRALIDIFRAFRERQSGHWLLERIAQMARQSLRLDSCMLVEYDPDRKAFTERGAAGLIGQEPDYRLPPASASLLLNGAGPTLVRDVQADPILGHADLFQQEQIQRLVVCPLRVEGTPLGLLFAGYRHQQEIKADELEAIALFADLAGMVIREIQLREALSQTQKRLQRRLFLDWVTMVDNTWRHSLVGKAAAIRNKAASLWRYLQRYAPELLSAEGIPGTLSDIDDLAREIAKAPPQVPQSWELEEELIPLAPLLQEVAQREGRKSTLHLDERAEIETAVDDLAGVQVRGYRRWLIYALEALLQNAFKAMPEGGVVTIRGQRRDGWAEVRVCDTGVGMPTAVRNKLFKEAIPKERDSKGMGIGALLVATIIEDHEGSVELEPHRPGGTTVLIRLPLAEEEKV